MLKTMSVNRYISLICSEFIDVIATVKMKLVIPLYIKFQTV